MFQNRLYGAAIQEWQRLHSAARKAGEDAWAVRAANAMMAAWIEWGDLFQARQLAHHNWREAARLPRTSSDAFKALFNLALVELYTGHLRRASAAVEELWRRQGRVEGIGPVEAARLRHLTAALWLMQGRWREGAEEALAVERELAALGLEAFAAQAQRNAGIGQLELGDLDRAEELLAAAAHRQHRVGEVAELAFTRTEQGRAAVRRSRPETALQFCQHGLQTLLDQPSGLNYIEMARLCGVMGSALAGGEGLLERAAQWLQRAGHRQELDRYARLWALKSRRLPLEPPREIHVAERLLDRTESRTAFYRLSPARRVAAKAHAVGPSIADAGVDPSELEQVAFLVRVPGDRVELALRKKLGQLAQMAATRPTAQGDAAPEAKAAAVLHAYDRLLQKGFHYVDALSHLALRAGDLYDASAVDRLVARHLQGERG